MELRREDIDILNSYMSITFINCTFNTLQLDLTKFRRTLNPFTHVGFLGSDRN